MRVIKAHELVEQRRIKGEHLPYDADLAMSHFRAFYQTGSAMIPKVDDVFARNVMIEVLEMMLDALKTN